MKRKITAIAIFILAITQTYAQEKMNRFDAGKENYHMLLGDIYTRREFDLQTKEPNVVTEKHKVRLSRIVVDSTRLEEYNAFLKEEIEASMTLEEGVLTLYATSEKERPNHITILEIYASEDAYKSHIKTPHFIKYKEGTLDMVQELELIDTNPLIEGLKIK